MADSALDKFTTSINDAILSDPGPTGSDQVPGAINQATSKFIADRVLPLLTGVAIFVTVLFVFYGAFLYFTAYGDENKATQAKKTLTYAIIGFAIAVMSLAIINYVKRSFITGRYENKLTNPTEETGDGTPAQEQPNVGGPVQDPGGNIPEPNPEDPALRIYKQP